MIKSRRMRQDYGKLYVHISVLKRLRKINMAHLNSFVLIDYDSVEWGKFTVVINVIAVCTSLDLYCGVGN